MSPDQEKMFNFAEDAVPRSGYCRSRKSSLKWDGDRISLPTGMFYFKIKSFLTLLTLEG